MQVNGKQIDTHLFKAYGGFRNVFFNTVVLNPCFSEETLNSTYGSEFDKLLEYLSK